MHEHSFIEGILKNVQDLDKVKKLKLEVGELVGIEAEHLKEHMEEGRNFEVEVLGGKSRARCECGFDGRARILERLHDLVIFECPECGSIPEILEGDKIRILKVVYN